MSLNRFYEFLHPDYNSFDITYFSTHNKRRIKALLKVQPDIIDEVLTERQKEIIEYVFFDNYTQKETAEMLGINPSTVSRHIKASLRKMRRYFELCDEAIKYYIREGDR